MVWRFTCFTMISHNRFTTQYLYIRIAYHKLHERGWILVVLLKVFQLLHAIHMIFGHLAKIVDSEFVVNKFVEVSLWKLEVQFVEFILNNWTGVLFLRPVCRKTICRIEFSSIINSRRKTIRPII